MLTENLAKLKELDPTTWCKYDALELAEYHSYDDYGKTTDYIYADDLIESARMAWLQWCLQEAITARGWHQSTSGIECNGYNWQTYIHINDKDLIRSEWHDTPTASLLAAYIAALEAQG